MLVFKFEEMKFQKFFLLYAFYKCIQIFQNYAFDFGQKINRKRVKYKCG
jgi:hypothetical protein